MKLVKKALSVTLSLVLCGSLVAPGFAAINLNEYVTTAERVEQNGSTFVDLKAVDGDNTFEMTDDLDTSGYTLRVSGKGNEIVLNMNGYTLDHKDTDGSVIKVGNHGNLTINGEGEEGEKGVITGGNAVKYPTNPNYMGSGGGIYAGDPGTQVKVNNVSIEENKAGGGGGIYVGTGAKAELDNVDIKNNQAVTHGGGIYANGTNVGAEVKISNSNIQDNEYLEERDKKASFDGGGIAISGKATVTVSGKTTVTGNEADRGGGIYVDSNGSALVVEGGSINGNTAKSSGGGVYNSGSMTMEDGSINGNTADSVGGGIYVNTTGTAALNGGAVYDNEAAYMGDDIAKIGSGKLTVGDAQGTLDGKRPVSNWYLDGSGSRWEDGNYDQYTGEETGTLYLKAAHDQYFQLTDADGKVLADVEKGTEIDVSKLEEPTREGYTFTGWADKDGNTVTTTITVDKAIVLTAQWKEDEPEQPTTPGRPVITPVDPTVEIDEPDVPLAGLPPYLTPAEPEDKLTRAQVVAILHWMDSEPAAELATFIDVLADSDYAEAIGWAQENGIAFGMGDNRFAPEEYVTRGQLIEFLNRYAAYVGSDLVLELDGDADEILTWAVAEEIINDFFNRL